MKQIILLLFTLFLLSCNNSNHTPNTLDSERTVIRQDTVLLKIKNKMESSSQMKYFSRSYTYCWVIGQDTLDLKIGLSEHIQDHSIQIHVFNKKPVLFTAVIDKINECLPLIQEDFDLENLSSLDFGPPIFYQDLATELSKEYSVQFGKKHISYDRFIEFLMNSWLEEHISIFLAQFNKTTQGYRMEKFHLLDKADYQYYIPNADLNEYPEFSIHGMGISAIIKD